jgi:hypothetical protein
VTAISDNNYAGAQSYLEDSLATGRELGSAGTFSIGWALSYLGELAMTQGEHAQAHKLFEEGAVRLREAGQKAFLAMPIRRLGQLALHAGDSDTAAALCQESLALNLEVGDRLGIAACLAGLAAVDRVRGQPVRAAQLIGAADALVESTATLLIPLDQALYQHTTAALRAQLDPTVFAVATAEGRALTQEQAVSYALENPDSPGY